MINADLLSNHFIVGTVLRTFHIFTLALKGKYDIGTIFIPFREEHLGMYVTHMYFAKILSPFYTLFSLTCFTDSALN